MRIASYLVCHAFFLEHVIPSRDAGVLRSQGCDCFLFFVWWQDIIILPEEAVYKKVDTGHEGERVFILEIAGNRRFFYWMQDKSSDKDEVSICTKVVQYVEGFDTAAFDFHFCFPHYF